MSSLCSQKYLNHPRNLGKENRMQMMKMISFFVLLFVLTTFNCETVSGFSAPNPGSKTSATEKGWEERPLVPELANSNSSGKPKERVPWDGLRFLKQSSKFISLPKLFGGNAATEVINPGDVIWEPDSTSSAFSWSPLDDVVMGGASESEFDVNTGIWKGTVTSANNGGFVGIRTTPSYSFNMENCKGIELVLKGGGGKRFKAVVRDSTDFNGVCWTSSFNAPKSLGLFLGSSSGVGTVKIPFGKQIPTIFARTVPDQTFMADNVVGLQLAYSKFEYDGKLNPNFELGDFDLQILEVRTY